MTIRDISIAIADDHQIIRVGMEKVISLLDNMVVTHQFADAHELLAADLSTVHVLLLDLNMPGSAGVGLVETLHNRYKSLRIIVFSMLPEESFATRALAAGASAFLNKNKAPDDVIAAIQAAVALGRHVPEGQQDKLLALEADPGAPLHQNLSPREFDIFRMVASGRKPTEIAAILDVRVGTITTHIHRIKRKLGAKSLGELVSYAHRHDLVGD